MKILFITSSYLPHYGGLETVVREISSRILEQGHDVAIITNRYPRNLKSCEEIEAVQVARMLFLYPSWQQLTSGRFDLWFSSLLIFPLTLIRLGRYIFRFRPDVVNLHYPNHQILFVWILSHLFSFRLIVSLHGGDVDAEPYKSRFKMWLFRTIMRRADWVTACSKNLLDQAVHLEPGIKTKSLVIHNGVYADLFLNASPYQHPRRYILGAGKLEHHKGFDTLINAFIDVVYRLSDVDLLIAGDGSEQQTLADMVHRHLLDDRVFFLGRKSREEIASLMRGASVIVIPSRREPFGIVGLEAMASGRPVIASQVGGLGEAMEGGEVTWFLPDDTRTLAATLYEILNNQEFTVPSEINRRIASKKDWNRVAEEYLYYNFSM